MNVLDFLPECKERGCTITRTQDIVSMRYVYQHGERPEAVLCIDVISSLQNPAEDARQKLRAFTEACHRYEDGGVER